MASLVACNESTDAVGNLGRARNLNVRGSGQL